MAEPERADRNDSISLFCMQPRGLRIEDYKIGFQNWLPYVETKAGLKMIPDKGWDFFFRRKR